MVPICFPTSSAFTFTFLFFKHIECFPQGHCSCYSFSLECSFSRWPSSGFLYCL
jgi:hypothetical protein